MSTFNLPPGVTDNDVDPGDSPLEHYLNGMSDTDMVALGLSDDLSAAQIIALENLWEAAERYGYQEGVKETKMGLNDEVEP